MNTNLIPRSGSDLALKLAREFQGWSLGSEQAEHQKALLRGLIGPMAQTEGSAAAACALAWWMTTHRPLDAEAIRITLDFDNAVKFLPEEARTLFAALMPLVQTVSDDEALLWHVTAQSGDMVAITRYLLTKLRTAAAPTLLGHIWKDLLRLGSGELPLAALDACGEHLPETLKNRLRAEALFHYATPREASEAAQALGPEWTPWATWTIAECHAREGDTASAVAVLAPLWQAMPWHVNLTLRLFELIVPVAPAQEEKTADVAILAYSWNKASLLADTLESVARTGFEQARIFALDNGSTDDTQDVLRAAKDRFGDRLSTVTLPINVGAPAARNWLLSLPEVRKCEWAAFLDDDVVLPQGWLTDMLGAAKMLPNTGAVGCRITEAKPPFGLQSADYNIFPHLPQPGAPENLPNRLPIFDNCSGEPDTGLFTYTRPCLSVSGCTHLISMRAVEKAGAFDLRYTPSQFDDLDRDLRSALSDMPAIYAGSVAIRHVQHSSLAKAKTDAQMGHVMGNKLKLDTKYTDDQLRELISKNHAQLSQTLIERLHFLLDRFAIRS